jgi:hypothetical protein
MSLIEMMIACVVLMVGVLSMAALIPLAIGTNSKNRQQSNSTVIAQMLMEKILSVPPGAPTPTLSDCTGASTTITASGSATGSGGTLLSSGDIDFSQTAGSAGNPTGYYMLYTACGSGGRQSTYDVRWNIKTPSPYAELVTVSAKLRGSNNNLVLFSPSVTIRSMIGQGD